MKKKILIAAAISVAVLVLIAVILFVVVDVDDFREFIETRAEQALGTDVRLGDLSLSFFPAIGIRAADVAVAGRAGEEDLASLRSLRIGARLMPLFKKRLEVTSIELVEPAVSLIRDEKGRWNFDLAAAGDAPPPADQHSSTPALTIDSLRITRGRITVRDASESPDQPLEVTLTDLDLELEGFGSEQLRVLVDRGRLAASHPSMGTTPVQLELASVDLAARGGGDEIDLERLELAAGSTTVTLTGTVRAQPDGRRIDLDLEPTTIDPDDVTALLAAAAGDLGLSLSGDSPIELEAGIHGVMAAGRTPELGARVTVRSITLDAAALTRPVTDIDAVATLRGTTLGVEGLRATAGDSDFSGKLELTVKDTPTLVFDFESERADLGELLGLIAGDDDETAEDAPPDPDSFLVRGVADGTLTVADGSWLNLRFRDLDARLHLERGVATLEPVSMKLYDGSFSGRLESDLATVPQTFEFSGEADGIDMDPFVADQVGKGGWLFGRFTGRIEGQGAGIDPTTVLRSLEGQGVARIIDGQVGKLDVLRTLAQVAGVLGQQTLANLASDSVTGATRFSQLGGDFRIGDGTLSFDSVLLQSTAFDLSGTGTVDLVSSELDGAFEIQFSPEVSAWMRQEGSRAAELFWDSKRGRVVLPLGLEGPLDGAGASVDWNAAVEGVARRTIERELTDLLGDVLGGDRDEEPP
jgi:AsmA protein